MHLSTAVKPAEPVVVNRLEVVANPIAPLKTALPPASKHMAPTALKIGESLFAVISISAYTGAQAPKAKAAVLSMVAKIFAVPPPSALLETLTPRSGEATAGVTARALVAEAFAAPSRS